jgi:serine/threonine protein kinase
VPTLKQLADGRSVGCIFAELLGRKPLFPGKDYVHQLNLITKVTLLPRPLCRTEHSPRCWQVIGSPLEEELHFISSEKARRYIRSLPHCNRVDFARIYPNVNHMVSCAHGGPLVSCPPLAPRILADGQPWPLQAVDLVDRMLVFDPAKRIKVEDALRHPYLSSLHDASDEPLCPVPFEFDFEAEHLTADVIRELIYEDMMEFQNRNTVGDASVGDDEGYIED